MKAVLLPVVFLVFNLKEMSFSLCNVSDPSWGTNGTFQGGSGACLPMCLEKHPFTWVSLFFWPVGHWGSFLADTLVFLPALVSKLFPVLLLFSAWSFWHTLEGAAALLASLRLSAATEPLHQYHQTHAPSSGTHFVCTPAHRGTEFIPGWLLVAHLGYRGL